MAAISSSSPPLFLKTKNNPLVFLRKKKKTLTQNLRESQEVFFFGVQKCSTSDLGKTTRGIQRAYKLLWGKNLQTSTDKYESYGKRVRENGREYAVNVALRERKRERVLERERKERVFIDGETNNTL